MKTRIAIWAVTGALVVTFWALYIMSTRQNLLGAGGVGWAMLCLTCPIALESHRPLSIYQVLVANAATYTLAGVVVETIRRHFRIRSISH